MYQNSAFNESDLLESIIAVRSLQLKLLNKGIISFGDGLYVSMIREMSSMYELLDASKREVFEENTNINTYPSYEAFK